MARPAEEGVVGPDGEDVTPALLELLAIFHGEGTHVADAFGTEDRDPAAAAHVVGRDDGEGRRVPALRVHPGRGVEDLVDAVRVQGEDERGDAREVAIEPFDRADRVLHRPWHEEAGPRRAERDLAVDAEGGDPLAV